MLIPQKQRKANLSQSSVKPQKSLGPHGATLNVVWPVLLLLAIFWAGGQLVTFHILMRQYDSTLTLDANTQISPQSRNQILTIAVNTSLAGSQVTVSMSNQTLKQLVFEYPLVDPLEIQAAISQELGLTSAEVEDLIEYLSQ